MGIVSNIVKSVISGIGHGAGVELFNRGKKKVEEKLEEKKKEKSEKK